MDVHYYTILINIISYVYSASWESVELNLTKYDYDRPPWEVTGQTVEVDVGVVLSDLRSVTITEIQSSFNLIQRWSDPRLVFDPASVTFGYTLLDRPLYSSIWIPDVYVSSAVTATQHSVTQPNDFVRIYPNGTLLKSTRLTVSYLCPLSYAAFPHATQPCSMKLKSYSFTTQELSLKWLNEKTYLSDEFVSSGVTVIGFDLSTCAHNIHGENQPCLEMKFRLEKNFVSYIIRIYVPSTLIVVLGWLSMWLDKGQVGARTSLGVLCVVSILTQSLGVMVMLPDAEGLLAVDIWMGVCMLFATSALFVFALVHNMVRRRGKPKVQEKYKKDPKDEEEGRDIPAKKCDIHPARVQNAARVIYPLAFVSFNIIYWAVFLAQ